MTKIVVPRPIERKEAEKVASQPCNICFLGAPHILHNDNGREFKNVDLAKITRELRPGFKIIHGKPHHPQS